MSQPVHLQYNSPMELYSRESAQEQLEQQVGGVIPLPNSERHFDPSKSQVLKEIQSDPEDTFGQNFAEKIARAETPNVPAQREPAWAGYAREKAERARSRTPGAREYTPSYGEGPRPQPLQGAVDEAREYAEKSKTYVHTTDPHTFGAPYYQVQQGVPRRRQSFHDNRGYEHGGTDFTYGMPIVDDGRYVDLNSHRKYRAPIDPRYAAGGQDYGTGSIGYGSYHGYGPDPPRLRPQFSADPRAPINPYVASNVDAVDPTLLVGDTLSNQKVRREAPPRDTQFGTSFAPPEGHRREHRSIRREPPPPQPVTYSLSAKRSSSVPRSSAPEHQKDVFWSTKQAMDAKEVTIATLLNDEALKVRHIEEIPYWADYSLSAANKWKHKSDPRLDRPEIYATEPNWKRTVDERKNAWERKAFDTEARLSLPPSAKIPAEMPPDWQEKAHGTHNVWQRAADRQGNSQYNGYRGQSNMGHDEQANYQEPWRNERHGGGQYQINDYQRTEQRTVSGQHTPHAQLSPNKDTVESQRGIETDIANTGYNSNQLAYVRERQTSPSVGLRSTNIPVNVNTVTSYSSFSPQGGSYSTSQHGNNFTSSNYNSNFKNTSNQPGGFSSNYNNSSNQQGGFSSNYNTNPQSFSPNQGGNYNQSNYERNEHRSAKTTTTTQATPIPLAWNAQDGVVPQGGIGGGVRGGATSTYTNTSQGEPATGNYSKSEHYTEEKRDPTGQNYSSHSFSRSEQKSTSSTTTPVPVYSPQSYSHGTNIGSSNFHSNFDNKPITNTSAHNLGTSTYTKTAQGAPDSGNYSTSEHYSTENRDPSGRSYNSSSFSRSEQKSTKTTTSTVPVAAPPPVEHRQYESYNRKYEKNEKTTTTSTPVASQMHSPITQNTQYTYTQQPVPSQPTQSDIRYERLHSHEKETHEHEESRPISQLSQYSEEKRYNKSHKTETTTTKTIAPPPVSTTTTQYSTDAFDRKKEMAETLPRGSISNTLNNTHGAYTDKEGHDVSYKRELSTSADPGKEYALLKEEEKRVVEKNLEPGVISRHVTTKYYKKKTTTDTTTTTVPE